MTPPATPALDSFLAPASIAVIGASPNPAVIRGALLHLLRRNGYGGRLYPVNPSYQEIDGLPCYPSVQAIGAPVDLALVAIPAAQVLPALEACAAAGVRHAAVISSGFAEEGGASGALQAEMAALARRTGMRVSGPNAQGFYNAAARIAATFSPAVDRAPDAPSLAIAGARRIGIVAQSGGLGFALYDRGRALGLAFSYVVTTGNEADLTVADFLDHMVRDAATDAILLFLESVRDPVAFLAAAAAAAAAGKPVVAVKVGRSPGGQRAAASHTASMTGWVAAYQAAFRSHGIIEAADPDEAMAIMAALTTCVQARGRRAAVITVSGGAGAWVADTLAACGLTVPELGEPTQAAVRKFIPSYGSAANPVDITAQGARGGGTLRAIELLAADDEVDLVVTVTSLASETHVAVEPEGLARVLSAARKPVLFLSYTLVSPYARRAFAEAGAAVQTGFAALGAAARALSAQPVPPAVSGAVPAALRERIAGLRGPLAEHAAKALLADAGIPVPASVLVRDRAGLAAAARLGFPLAAKIQSADIPHKTEAGGVRLGLGDPAALEAAYDAVLEGARRHAPAARIEGVLVERMAAPGVEMIVGVVRDPTFGPVLMLGAGGVTTELYRDVAYRLAPVDEAGAAAMLEELRAAALLRGFRGAPAADAAALARLVASVSRLAHACRDTVREIELNPVLVHPAGAGCTVVDALLVAEPAPGAMASPLSDPKSPRAEIIRPETVRHPGGIGLGASGSKP